MPIRTPCTLALAFAAAAITIASPNSARASEPFDRTLDFSLHGDTGLLDQGAVTLGPKARGGWTLNGFRIGAGVGLLRVSRYDAWGLPTELFVGYAYGDPESMRLYVDVRATATHLFPSSDANAPRPADRWLLGFGPRLGLCGPIGEYFFYDVSVTAGFGGERFGVSWGLGIPIPTSHL